MPFPTSPATRQHKPKLLDQVRQTIRRKHYSLRTEQAYVDWIRRYIFFHKKRHPAEMGAQEMEQFLNHLAVDKKVAASTQNQALSALVFLYREVLRQEFDWMDNLERAKRPVRVPVVLTETEVKALLARLDGQSWLMATLLYGAGLRLMECVRLRVKDIDFARGEIMVRDGKGEKDRLTMMPQSLKAALQVQIESVRHLHEHDLKQGYGEARYAAALRTRLRRESAIEEHLKTSQTNHAVPLSATGIYSVGRSKMVLIT